MTGLEYARWRRSLGDARAAARVLGCSRHTIRFREEGYARVTPRLAWQVRAAVWDAALAEDARRAAVRRRRRERRAARQAMTAAELRAVLAALGWTRAYFAEWLMGGEPGDEERVGRWMRGKSVVPEWVARHLREELGLSVGDPWPTGVKRHEVVLPGGN